MLRLVRFLISCVLLSTFIWFAVTVPLGKRTLWGHLVRISRTEEARDLADGAKDTAKDVARRVRDEIHTEPDMAPAPRKRKPPL